MGSPRDLRRRLSMTRSRGAPQKDIRCSTCMIRRSPHQRGSRLGSAHLKRAMRDPMDGPGAAVCTHQSHPQVTSRNAISASSGATPRAAIPIVDSVFDHVGTIVSEQKLLDLPGSCSTGQVPERMPECPPGGVTVRSAPAARVGHGPE